jgi:hypothetical protein
VVLYRTGGTGGGLLRLGLLARRRVELLFWVCDSTIVGAAAQAVSATRMAMRILRENIFSHYRFQNHIGG